jgi:hypothetical protein
MYWLVEPNIELNDFDVLDYRPSVHDEHYEHVWKWDNTNYGGLRLLPADASDGVKEVNKVVCRKRFDTLNTKTPGKYFDKHPFATHVWCVDKDYRLTDDIDWAPSNFEPDFVHTFHLRGQLEHKYPADEGGIKLYPRKFKVAKIKSSKHPKFQTYKLPNSNQHTISNTKKRRSPTKQKIKTALISKFQKSISKQNYKK